jgi:hypothetical protein
VCGTRKRKSELLAPRGRNCIPASGARIGKLGAEPVSLFLALSILLLTVLASLGLGIAASYMLINTILIAFGQHSRTQSPTPRLVESAVSGD